MFYIKYRFILEKRNIVRNFSAISKKKLKEALIPHGYQNWRRFFYALEDDIFILILVRGEFQGENSLISTYVDPIPYCVGFCGDDLDLSYRGPIRDFFPMLQRIMPEDFPFEYYWSRVSAKSVEGTIRSLDFVCGLLEEHVVPYLQKLADLEFFYKEAPVLKRLEAPKSPWSHIITKEMFRMSIKLRKYEDAMAYLAQREEVLRQSIRKVKNDILDWKNGNFKNHELSLQKKDSNHIEIRICAAEKAILKDEEEISDIQIMREAFLSNEYIYLDSYVKEIEDSSRRNLQEMLTGKQK